MQFEIDDFDICSTYSINFKLETSDCTMMPRQMVSSVVKFDLSNTNISDFVESFDVDTTELQYK